MPGDSLMDDYEALELAPKAVEKVSHIAAALGATKGLKACGRLGGELLIAADHLKSAGPEQQDQLLRKVRKLLRDIERICSVSIRFSYYPRVRGHDSTDLG
jgi:hypothetical protein